MTEIEHMLLPRYARRLNTGRVVILALICALLLARGCSRGDHATRDLHMYTASDATLPLRVEQCFGVRVLPASLHSPTLTTRPAAAVLTLQAADPSVRITLTEVQIVASKFTRRLYVSPNQARAGAISTTDRTVMLGGRRTLFQQNIYASNNAPSSTGRYVLYFGFAGPERRLSLIVAAVTPQAEDKTIAAIFELVTQMLQADPHLQSVS